MPGARALCSRLVVPGHLYGGWGGLWGQFLPQILGMPQRHQDLVSAHHSVASKPSCLCPDGDHSGSTCPSLVQPNSPKAAKQTRDVHAGGINVNSPQKPQTYGRRISLLPTGSSTSDAKYIISKSVQFTIIVRRASHRSMAVHSFQSLLLCSNSFTRFQCERIPPNPAQPLAQRAPPRC